MPIKTEERGDQGDVATRSTRARPGDAADLEPQGGKASIS